MNPNPKCPKLPWMIEFHSSEKGETFNQQYSAAFASTALGHLSDLTYKSKPSIFRSTQLICTLTSIPKPVDLENSFEVGISIVRIATSRNEIIKEIIGNVRTAVQNFSKKLGRPYPVGLALEMKGPLTRTGQLKQGNKKLFLEKGEITTITTDSTYEEFVDKSKIFVDYEKLPEVVAPGDTVFIEDGAIRLSAIECAKNIIKCIVEKAGQLLSHSSVVIPNVPVDLPPLSNDDKALIQIALDENVDFIFISGLTGREALNDIKSLMEPEGKTIQLISKIENCHAVNELDDIIQLSDGICIDCGRLLQEMPREKIFILQKSILAKCNLAGKPSICTLMLSSEDIAKPEITDIANAIIDGSHALLLPPYFFPQKSLQIIDAVCREAEAAVHQTLQFREVKESLKTPMESLYSLAIAATEISFKSNAAAIICLTSSGRTAKMIARFRPRCPIIAVTRYARISRQLRMHYGIDPLLYPKPFIGNWIKDVNDRLQYAVTYGKYAGYIRMGDVLVTISSSRPEAGIANTMNVVYASEFDALTKVPKQKTSVRRIQNK